jgi:hypothetical protein
MTAVLIFVGVLVAMVAAAMVINRARGAKAHYLDDWQPERGERRRSDDPAADFYAVPRMGQAKVMSFARMHRTHVVLTDTRLVIGKRALMSKRYMITHMIHLDRGEAAATELAQLTGGQFTKGFITYCARPDRMSVEADGEKAYLRIALEPTASAAMIEHCRLYSDHAAEILKHATAA